MELPAGKETGKIKDLIKNARYAILKHCHREITHVQMNSAIKKAIIAEFEEELNKHLDDIKDVYAAAIITDNSTPDNEIILYYYVPGKPKEVIGKLKVEQIKKH